MMRIWQILVLVALVVVSAMAQGGGSIGKVSYVEGEAFLERSGKAAQKLSVNMKVRQGDVLRTGVESILEITLGNGTVLRFAEKARGVLNASGDNGNVKMESGKLWANVQKMQKGGFSVSTPVATAAVRGTIFRVETHDSVGSTVALYEGLVDVGPADSSKIKAPEPASDWGPPVQVPGPYEVSLEDWVRLKPGKQIHVQDNGKFATGDIDATKDSDDQWVKFNLQRDLSVKR